MQNLQIRFIVNPIAGFRRDKSHIIDLINLYYQTTGIDLVITSGPGEATHLARQAAEKGFDVVVAVGGDGTVNEVASGLVDSDTALGIIPRGSGNGLARSLGIPIQPAGAFEVLINANTRIIDVGRAAHRYFFVVSGVGFDANVGMKFNTTSWRGPLPYFFIVAKEFASYNPEPLKVFFDDNRLEFSPFLLTIANTKQYGNGAIIAPHAQPDDGMLDMCIIEPLNVFTALMHAPKLFTGSINQAPIVSYRQATDIEINKSGPILFHVDGETQTCEGPLKISILPKALKVVVPSSINDPNSSPDAN